VSRRWYLFMAPGPDGRARLGGGFVHSPRAFLEVVSALQESPHRPWYVVGYSSEPDRALARAVVESTPDPAAVLVALCALPSVEVVLLDRAFRDALLAGAMAPPVSGDA
jgi:hypothetical protein